MAMLSLAPRPSTAFAHEFDVLEPHALYLAYRRPTFFARVRNYFSSLESSSGFRHLL